MIDRYSNPEMKNIWSDESKYNSWLLVELYTVEAYARHNKKITKTDIQNLWSKCKINVNDINEIEKKTKHDVIAFTRSLSKLLGDEKRWIHYGITSTDVVDTGLSFQLKKANKILSNDLEDLLKTIKRLALKHMETFQIGRTHGIHAEITTFGYKIALWYDEMKRNIKRFKDASNDVHFCKISGAVGNYANIPIAVQEYVSKKMNLNSSVISNQTLQRDRHAHYLSVLSLIAASLDKFAIEIRHLQRTEVSEVAEGFDSEQKGSSSMPHKKNPISLENISGLSRVIKGYAQMSFENIPLWHERDISHSSVERIIIPDSTILLDYILKKFNNVLNNIVVNKKQMLKNINLTRGIIFSQRAMNMLIDYKNYSRENAYDFIQKISLNIIKNEKKHFKDEILKTNIFNQKEIDELFDYKYYLKGIKKIFSNLFII